MGWELRLKRDLILIVDEGEIVKVRWLWLNVEVKWDWIEFDNECRWRLNSEREVIESECGSRVRLDWVSIWIKWWLDEGWMMEWCWLYVIVKSKMEVSLIMNVDGDWRLNSEGKVMKNEYRSGVRLDWVWIWMKMYIE